jgi:hypothetical protein
MPANRSSIKALRLTRSFDDVDQDRATGRASRAGVVRHVAGIAGPGDHSGHARDMAQVDRVPVKV